MDKRKCPKCGSVWHSADTITPWRCTKCGKLIPKGGYNNETKDIHDNNTADNSTTKYPRI